MSTNEEAITAVEAALRVILEPGQVTELRALNYGIQYQCTMSGYFNDFGAMAAEAVKLTRAASGVYFIPNPVNPELLARVCNRAKQMRRGDNTTSDTDVLSRRWFLIDCDAVRPTGISASDDEHSAVLGNAAVIQEALTSDGWPMPLCADSGNGGHLMYRIDLPADDGGLLRRCLEALQLRFQDDTFHVDTSVFNPARIWKLYGTRARKGDATPTRPHRIARLLHVPEPLEVVRTELLQALADSVCAEHGPSKTGTVITAQSGNSDSKYWLESWISTHLPTATHKTTTDGDVWTIPVCPFNPDHNRGEAFVIRRCDGTIGADCKHESCTWGWRELRERLEPGCYSRHDELQAGLTHDDRAGASPANSFAGNIYTLTGWFDRRINADWIVDGLLRRGELAFLYGAPKSGKTFLIIDLIMALATGTSWCNDRFVIPKPMNVVLAIGEGHHGLKSRFEAALSQWEMTPAAIGDRISIVPVVPQLFPMWQGEGDSAATFIGEISEAGVKPDLLVLDTYARAILGADENSNRDAGLILHTLQSIPEHLGCATLVVHHANKGLGDLRGASAILGGADLVLKCSRDGRTRKLELELAKDIPEMSAVPFDLWPIGDTGSVCVRWGDSDPSSSLSLDDRIMEFLNREKDQTFTAKEIGDALDVEQRGIINRLWDLKRQGFVVETLRNHERPKSNQNPYEWRAVVSSSLEGHE